MIINTKHKFIFGGISRSAATSIHKALRKFHDFKIEDPKHNFKGRVFKKKKRGKHYRLHKHAHFALAVYFVPEFSSYYKFCIIRNPWERMVSRYFYSKNSWIRKGIKKAKPAFDMNFTDWIQSRVWEKNFPLTIREFVAIPESDGVWGYELNSLNFLVSDFKKRFGINIKILHRNRTKHKNYEHYYDEESKKIVESNFSWIIDKMGYVFGNSVVAGKVLL